MKSKTVAAILIALPLLRVAATYPVFCQTTDEPFHIGAGLQWLTARGYDLDPEHPPLARILLAAGPALAGARVTGNALNSGNDALWRGGRYVANLAASRAGNLPFLLAAVVIVGLWTRRLYGDTTALVAMALFGALPPVLGHAGVSTTDMSVTATTAAALLAFDCWLEAPSMRNASLTAVAIAAGLLSKYSFIIFFVPAALLFTIGRLAAPRHRATPQPRHLATLLLVPPIVFLIVWSGYKFDVGTINDARLKAFPPGLPPHGAARYATVPGYEWVRLDILERYFHYSDPIGARHGKGVDFVDWAKAAGYPSPAAGRNGNTLAGAPPVEPPTLAQRIAEPFRAAYQRVAVRHRVPAPFFFAGLEMVQRHSYAGHPSYLLGQFRDHGWWYYFPVVLFFKTPLPFLLLAIAGIVLALRERAHVAVALAPLAMLLPALTSGINIGVRHVLPLYPMLTISAAHAAVVLRRRSRPATIVLLGWYVVATSLAHPDYLAWFNEAAGRHPERIAVDSNLDWGQDLLRLERIVRKKQIEHLHLAYDGTADWRRLVPQAEELPQFAPVRGWVAVSENELTFGWPTNERNAFAWLRAYEPVRHVGRSIRLYRVP